MSNQKIAVNLWFDKNAEEAVKFYVLIFNNSKITRTTRYTKEGFDIHKMPEGTVMTIDFELDGQKFIALNGGPIFKFNEAMSLVIECESQEEIDYYWSKLSEGGDPAAQQCGWLKDQFGVSWQIVPKQMADMYNTDDTTKRNALMREMLTQHKLDIGKLQAAYDSA